MTKICSEVGESGVYVTYAAELTTLGNSYVPVTDDRLVVTEHCSSLVATNYFDFCCFFFV